jgi:hypothetical protein
MGAMSLKQYLLLMVAATLATYILFLMVLYFFDPENSGILGIIFFYVSLGLALVGTLSIVGLLVRVLFTSEKRMYRKVITSFRQSLLLSILIITALVLQRAHILSMLAIVFLVVALVLIETFFLSKTSSYA